jgi:hypothetical protein
MFAMNIMQRDVSVLSLQFITNTGTVIVLSCEMGTINKSHGAEFSSERDIRLSGQ